MCVYVRACVGGLGGECMGEWGGGEGVCGGGGGYVGVGGGCVLQCP